MHTYRRRPSKLAATVGQPEANPWVDLVVFRVLCLAIQNEQRRQPLAEGIGGVATGCVAAILQCPLAGTREERRSPPVGTGPSLVCLVGEWVVCLVDVDYPTSVIGVPEGHLGLDAVWIKKEEEERKRLE